MKGLDLLAEIDRLKRERNAVILAHYYQKPEIQDLADFVGDSLDLSRKAAETDADVIAFCGVRFMAETAKILSPEKTVDPARHGRRLQPRGQLPARPVRGVPRGAPGPYRADLHQLLGGGESAHRHHRHQSSSAQIILDQIPKDQKIIFGPDRHLGGYLARKTGRDMLLWPGICIVHQAFSETELLKLKAEHPDAPVAAHPECPPHIIDHADHVGSTRSILDFALSSPAQTILVATEPHIIHQMEKAAPDKTFIGVPGGDGNCNCNMCPYMALNTLEKLYVALRDLQPRIELSAEVMERARVPLERMLEMAGRTVGQGDVGKPHHRPSRRDRSRRSAATEPPALSTLFPTPRFTTSASQPDGGASRGFSRRWRNASASLVVGISGRDFAFAMRLGAACRSGRLVAAAPAAAQSSFAAQFPARILAAHNAERARAGVPPLVWDNALGQRPLPLMRSRWR